MVSGESIPVEKKIDDKVPGGTINGTGSFVMKIERVSASLPLPTNSSLIVGCQSGPKEWKVS